MRPCSSQFASEGKEKKKEKLQEGHNRTAGGLLRRLTSLTQRFCPTLLFLSLLYPPSSVFYTLSSRRRDNETRRIRRRPSSFDRSHKRRRRIREARTCISIISFFFEPAHRLLTPLYGFAIVYPSRITPLHHTISLYQYLNKNCGNYLCTTGNIHVVVFYIFSLSGSMVLLFVERRRLGTLVENSKIVNLGFLLFLVTSRGFPGL